ncbi:MAG: 50S ribosomal protein L32 [Bdellovibrionota bacterium]|nr:MAG: 50S ribosomal protein L32 [Bdellovibrionota bacterium]
MMGPKKRTSKSRRDMRRSHDALAPSHPVVCSNCGEVTLRHRACPSCGMYRGRQIVKSKSSESSKPAAPANS